MSTLANKVAVGAPKIERAELFALVIALARFVAEVHEGGATVDDLRPAAFEVEPKGTDFVVRRVADVEAPSAESPEAVIARSPEQLRDAAFVSKTADVYGLGVLIYRLAAGRPPFVGESFHEMLLAIADGAAEPLEKLRPDLGAPLGETLRRAMAPDPALRFLDAQELLGSLEEAREAGPVLTETSREAAPPAPTAEGEAGENSNEEDAEPDPSDAMSGRWMLQLTLGFVVVIAVVAVGYHYLAPRRRLPQVTSEATLEAARAAASGYREKAAPPASSTPLGKTSHAAAKGGAVFTPPMTGVPTVQERPPAPGVHVRWTLIASSTLPSPSRSASPRTVPSVAFVRTHW